MSSHHPSKIFGKKGQFEEMESDKLILFMVFYMILFLVGIFTINRFVEGVEINLNCQTQNIEYSVLASRVLNSATCLAWEQPVAGKPSIRLRYASGGEWGIDGHSDSMRKQVRAGVIDLNKMHNGVTSIGDCLGTTIDKDEPNDGPAIKDIQVEVFDAEGNLKDTAIYGAIPFQNPVIDTFLVKIFDNGEFYDGRAKITIGMPTGEQCA